MLACALLPQLAGADGCALTPIGPATVRAVSATGVALEDGRTVTLDGIVDPNEGALAAVLPPGQPVILKRLGTTAADRYGRVPAHVFVTASGTEAWLQADLLARGLARVSSRVGDAACARELLAHERVARAANLGLWAEPYYVISKAEDPADVLQRRGRFVLVEGKVLSVRENGGTIYVNFGRRWSEDFTVTIAKRRERVFLASGIEPRTLAGRTVRIRGWIEERGGPWVEASRPEQIEVLERH